MLHVITNDPILSRPDFPTTATALLERLPDQLVLHLRTRELSGGQLYQLADRLVGAGGRALVLVNDRVDVAVAARASGVQLGVRSLPIARAREILGPAPRIGYSAHSAAEAARAEAEGANFVLVGTIYASTSHPERAPAGSALIRQAARVCRVPVIAIGGVTAERVGELRAAGAAGIAVISAVWNADEPVQAAAELVRLLQG